MFASFNFRTLVRFFSILIASLLIASFAPSFTEGEVLSLLTPLPVATIFAIVIAFYIQNALSRVKGIDTNVAIELSRIRRVYHVSKGFVGNRGIEKWAKELRERNFAYSRSFNSHDFGSYDDTNREFRELTYHIYQIDPKLLKTTKEMALYQDLLRTTREWALVRQNIQELRRQKISTYSWVVLFSISAILIFFVLMLRAQDIFSTKLVSALTIVAILFVLDLLWEINAISKRERRRIARRYLFNLDKLQMDLPESEDPKLTKAEEKKQEKEEGIKKQKVK